jgi:catechol 2,3-dioxygenase-like lactoylglutathione lyase family enzyme
LLDVQVIFAVGDLARSLHFYEQAFGWPRNERIDYANYVELHPPDGGTVGLFERRGYEELVGAPPVELGNGHVSSAYLYVRVPVLEETVARLEAAGARLLSPAADRSWGERAAWFSDPDGNVVAVAQRTTPA